MDLASIIVTDNRIDNNEYLQLVWDTSNWVITHHIYNTFDHHNKQTNAFGNIIISVGGSNNDINVFLGKT